MDIQFGLFFDMYQAYNQLIFSCRGQKDYKLLLYYFRWGKIIVIKCCVSQL